MMSHSLFSRKVGHESSIYYANHRVNVFKAPLPVCEAELLTFPESTISLRLFAYTRMF